MEIVSQMIAVADKNVAGALGDLMAFTIALRLPQSHLANSDHDHPIFYICPRSVDSTKIVLVLLLFTCSLEASDYDALLQPYRCHRPHRNRTKC